MAGADNSASVRNNPDSPQLVSPIGVAGSRGDVAKQVLPQRPPLTSCRGRPASYVTAGSPIIFLN
jgi:hypothetical protein